MCYNNSITFVISVSPSVKLKHFVISKDTYNFWFSVFLLTLMLYIKI